MIIKPFTIVKLLSAALLFTITANAQKLPNKQEVGLRAPANIKIDGRATEWNDQFQAHNLGNHIYYTLSNDDNNLYLTARMDDIQADSKIFKGGLTFTIIPLTKNANKVSLTFPFISWEKITERRDAGGNHLTLYSTLIVDTTANKAQIESLIATSNTEITKDYKEILVTGIPEINDPLLSIYNAQGIMAAASFDKKMRYTYELAIPLKYLESAISTVKSIKYDIRLNVLPIVKRNNDVQHTDMNVTFSKDPIPVSIDDMFRYNDTNFSGAYTLAKK